MSRKKFELLSTTFDKRGRPIVSKVNSYSVSHPLQAHFSRKAGMHEGRIFLHAELRSLIASQERKVHSLLVQRFDAKGNYADAKPCESCVEAMKAFGVKLVRWSTKDGIKEELVEDM